jgi:biotin carboxyl carrier protein
VKIALATIGIVAVIAAAVFIYTNRPITVQVAAIEHDVPVRVFGLGTVEARVLSKVGFEVGATLVELAADHGDRVAKGQVLARLGAGEQEAKVAKARAARLIAEVNIKRAEANLEKARAVLAQTQEANKRKQSLAGRDIVSQQAAEETARDEAVASAEVTVAESEVTSAKAQLADAQAQLQFEETMLRHRTLVAPYDALVIERHNELGTVVKAGDPIFTLIADGNYWGLAHVDEARAGFLSEGQHVDARLRSRRRGRSNNHLDDRSASDCASYFRAELSRGRQAETWWAGLLCASSLGTIMASLEALRDTDCAPCCHGSGRPPSSCFSAPIARLEAGRHLGDAIPGSRFIVLDGKKDTAPATEVTVLEFGDSSSEVSPDVVLFVECFENCISTVLVELDANLGPKLVGQIIELTSSRDGHEQSVRLLVDRQFGDSHRIRDHLD